MTNIIKFIAAKEPMLKKLSVFRKRTSLQMTAFLFLIITLVFVEIGTSTWRDCSAGNVAYAANERQVIHYPSMRLQMIVLSDGLVPEIIEEANDDVIIVSYETNSDSNLFNEVMGPDSEILSDSMFITDKVVFDNSSIEEQEQASELKQMESVKNESKKVNDSIDLEVSESIAEAEKAKENLEPVYINNPNMVIKLTAEELDLFERLVQCEAATEDMVGKILVANVIINRVNSSKFSNTVTGVITSPKQFSPVGSGAIYSAVPTQETKEAVQRALSGEDYSEGSLYFIARRYCSSSATSWFDNCLEKTVTHGNHEFFK